MISAVCSARACALLLLLVLVFDRARPPWLPTALKRCAREEHCRVPGSRSCLPVIKAAVPFLTAAAAPPHLPCAPAGRRAHCGLRTHWSGRGHASASAWAPQLAAGGQGKHQHGGALGAPNLSCVGARLVHQRLPRDVVCELAAASSSQHPAMTPVAAAQLLAGDMPRMPPLPRSRQCCCLA